MNEDFWLDKYPEGMPGSIDADLYPNIQAVLKEACDKYANKPAFTNMGKTISYAQLYQLSGDFAAWIQHHTDLQPGDRIAIQLPNLLQYPVVVFGAIRAGLVVVNTNPLYTAREMEHQFRDAGAKAIVCLANMAHSLEKILSRTDIKTVIITEVGDFLPPVKRWLVNSVVKYVRKMVPAYHIPNALRLNDALRHGKQKVSRNHNPEADSVAVLQYTGGTTGIAKGAMLTHRNLIANMLQARVMMASELDEGRETLVAPLPLYHIYAFTFHCMAMMIAGNHNLLITNPRDLKAMIKDLSKWRFSGFVGLNTLFVALCNDARFRALDFSALKMTVSGGMALQVATARRWEEVTGGKICEGYGLTETSPIATVNPISNIQLGTIGMPVPSTACKVVDAQNNKLPLGEAGELCVRGPQVMKGYWNNEEGTREVLDAEGWLRTGDIAVIQEDGYIRIVDRKKDMILVSGFNVFPNEVESVLASMPEVLQCAAIGVPDERTGEAVKVFIVVREGHQLTAEQAIRHMRKNLTSYKVARQVEFREALPVTNVGKVLRRELQAEELQKRSKNPA